MLNEILGNVACTFTYRNNNRKFLLKPPPSPSFLFPLIYFFRLKHNYKKHNNDTTQNVEWKQSNNNKKSSREIAIMGGMIYFKLKFLLPDLYFTSDLFIKAFCDCLFFNKHFRLEFIPFTEWNKNNIKTDRKWQHWCDFVERISLYLVEIEECLNGKLVNLRNQWFSNCVPQHTSVTRELSGCPKKFAAHWPQW
jgi:hypothetical protein